MKRLLVLAAGTFGTVGAALAVSGVFTAAPVSAQTCADTTPPLTPMRVVCVFNEQTGTFFMSANPASQVDTFLNGAPDDTDFGSLGVLHQPETFVNSIVGPGGFLDGPRSPE
jgi:hypothetical protein